MNKWEKKRRKDSVVRPHLEGMGEYKYWKNPDQTTRYKDRDGTDRFAVTTRIEFLERFSTSEVHKDLVDDLTIRGWRCVLALLDERAELEEEIETLRRKSYLHRKEIRRLTKCRK